MSEFKVFLSAPSDLCSEIISLKLSLTKFSKNTESRYGVRIIPVSEDDAERGPHRPQGSINKLLNQCDFFIGLMGKRFGSSTGAAESGTQEEFQFVFNKNEIYQRPQIRMFFKTLDESELNEDEKEQYNRVCAFKNRIGNNFFYDSYRLIDEVIQKVLKETEGFINNLPEIIKLSISRRKVEQGSSVSLAYEVKNAEIPLKLERHYKDGSYSNEYNFRQLSGNWTDEKVEKDSIYRLNASNKFGTRSKMCEVSVVLRDNEETKERCPITSLLDETETALKESSNAMKESECILKANNLLNRLDDHLVDFDNKRKRSDSSIFVVNKLSQNKYIGSPSSAKIIASHLTVIRSEIIDCQVIIAYKIGIKDSKCHLYNAIFKLVRGERPPWKAIENWKNILEFDSKSTLNNNFIDDSFYTSINRGLEIIAQDMSD